MFLETSALVAILAREPGSAALADQVETTSDVITSPLVIFEAVMVLSSRLAVEPVEAEKRVRDFLDGGAIAVTRIDDETASLAMQAFQLYGKGRGHSARLNLADCLSYACAKQHRVPLLYVGDDFAKTDLA